MPRTTKPRVVSFRKKNGEESAEQFANRLNAKFGVPIRSKPSMSLRPISLEKSAVKMARRQSYLTKLIRYSDQRQRKTKKYGAC